MKHLGLIGFPLSHSKSYLLHRVIARHLKHEMSYQVIEVQKMESIRALLDKVRTGMYGGLNVTIPYKEVVIPLLDELTVKAAKIGAVNTIYFKDGKLYGDNTDYDGFKALLETTQMDYSSKRVIILGSGGSAKAVYQVFKDKGVTPTIVSRTKQSDQHFAKVITYEALKREDYDLIINCTPVGMYPNQNASPLEKDLVEDKIVFDMIYNPSTTKLMSYAKVAYNGLDMLIIQAIHAQLIWFDEKHEITHQLIEKIRGEFNELIRNDI